MRKEKLVYIFAIILLAGTCIYYWTKKEDVFVMIDGNCQYSYKFIDKEGKYVDSTKVKDICKIVIKGGSPFNYEWMEVDLDQVNSYTIDLPTCLELVKNSPDFISYNYYWTSKKDMSRYKLFIVKQENKVFYILPVRSIHNGIE
jgi:hypothetical protein